MSVQIKEINKQIKIKAKQDVQKRPEFLAKQHQLKSKALQKEEKETEEQSELLQKLKSKSKQIEEHERQQEIEESKPEFMKVKLRSSTPSDAMTSWLCVSIYLKNGKATRSPNFSH